MGSLESSGSFALVLPYIGVFSKPNREILGLGSKKPPMVTSGVFRILATLSLVCSLRSANAVSRRGLVAVILVGVVHLELDRVRCVLQLDDLFHFQLNIGIDLLIGKDVALGQIRTIRVE